MGRASSLHCAIFLCLLPYIATNIIGIDGTGKEARLRHVWTNITGIDDSTHWPAEVHDKILLVTFLIVLMDK